MTYASANTSFRYRYKSTSTRRKTDFNVRYQRQRLHALIAILMMQDVLYRRGSLRVNAITQAFYAHGLSVLRAGSKSTTRAIPADLVHNAKTCLARVIYLEISPGSQ
jgi:hypothetical protein